MFGFLIMCVNLDILTDRICIWSLNFIILDATWVLNANQNVCLEMAHKLQLTIPRPAITDDKSNYYQKSELALSFNLIWTWHFLSFSRLHLRVNKIGQSLPQEKILACVHCTQLWLMVGGGHCKFHARLWKGGIIPTIHGASKPRKPLLLLRHPSELPAYS